MSISVRQFYEKFKKDDHLIDRWINVFDNPDEQEKMERLFPDQDLVGVLEAPWGYEGQRNDEKTGISLWVYTSTKQPNVHRLDQYTQYPDDDQFTHHGTSYTLNYSPYEEYLENEEVK